MHRKTVSHRKTLLQLQKENDVLRKQLAHQPLTVESATVHTVMPVPTGNVEENGKNLSVTQPLHDILASMRCIVWYAIVTQTPQGMDWQVTIPNQAGAEQYLPVLAIPGRKFPDSWREYILPEDRETMDRRSTDALLSGQADYSQQYRYRLPDGKLHWFHEECRIETLSPGRWWLVGVSTDITERKQTLESMRHVMAGAKCLIWHSTVEEQTDGKVIWDLHPLDEAAAQRLLPLALAPGQSYAEAWANARLPEDADRIDAFALENIRAGRDYSQEFRCWRRDGAIRWLSEEVRVEVVGEKSWRLVGVCTDITERKQTEAHMRQIMSSAHCLIWYSYVQKRPDDSLFWKSELIDMEAAQRFFPVDIVPGHTYFYSWHNARLSEDRKRTDSFAEAAVRSGQSYQQEYRCRHRDGSIRWHAENVRVEATSPTSWLLVGTCVDITPQKQAEERFRALVQNAADIIQVIDADSRVLYVSPAVTRLLGYKPEELIGRRGFDLLHPEDYRMVADRLREVLRNPDTPLSVDFRIQHKEGSWRWTECTATNMCHEPAVGGVILNYRDITERKRAAELIEWHAYHDPLTGLPNRALFQDRVEQALAAAERDHNQLGLLFIDLDRFKSINDSFGHDVGDELLRVVTTRFSGCVRLGDTIGRMGGDEFTVLLPGIKDPEEAINVAQRLLDALSEGIPLQGRELYVSASIGISVFPMDGISSQTLLKHADIAMYRVKERGRNSYELFTESMNVAAIERSMLQNSLRQAVERQEFVLYYQPQYAMADGKMTGAEALIRWQHLELDLVFPDKFISLAEESGLILPLGEWVLNEACRQAAQWNSTGKPLQVAVNVSPVQLKSPTFVASVASALSAAGLAPKWLNIELTESALIENSRETMHALSQLRDLGVAISVDDFGTGYSSLAYLSRLPLDVLKVDRSFVHGALDNPRDMSVVKAVIDLAHTLGLSVVAEGVEQEEQWNWLVQLGCDSMQGFLRSKPISAKAFAEMLALAPVG